MSPHNISHRYLLPIPLWGALPQAIELLRREVVRSSVGVSTMYSLASGASGAGVPQCMSTWRYAPLVEGSIYEDKMDWDRGMNTCIVGIVVAVGQPSSAHHNAT